MRWLFFLVLIQVVAKPLEVQIETPYAIVMDVKTGKVLYEKRGREKIYPGSTTKIGTALYILKNAPMTLDEMVVCSEDALRIVSEETKRAKGALLPGHILELDGTSAHLRRQEKLLGRDLLYAALLASGNDAANVLAEHVCGDIQLFVRKMNEMAIELGCKNTHFWNPHGLFLSDHTSTPYDMALLTREALKYSKFREVIKTVKYEVGKHVFNQGNGLIKPDHKFYYPGAFGIKTGYTRDAKQNIITGASNGEREVIVALHQSPSSKQRYQDAIALFDAVFAEPLAQRLLFVQEETAFEEKIPKGDKILSAVLKNDLYLKYYPSEEEKVQAKLVWKEISLPIEKGVEVAELQIISKEDGRILMTESLVAKEGVNKKWVYRALEGVKQYSLWVILPLGVGGAYFLFVRKRKAE